ncbi:MAG: hypothetical protein IJH59_06040, partial [Firmicutes bacterium]|nr:hypothetical protein [Bacillota bacterium]
MAPIVKAESIPAKLTITVASIAVNRITANQQTGLNAYVNAAGAYEMGRLTITTGIEPSGYGAEASVGGTAQGDSVEIGLIVGSSNTAEATVNTAQNVYVVAPGSLSVVGDFQI